MEPADQRREHRRTARPARSRPAGCRNGARRPAAGAPWPPPRRSGRPRCRNGARRPAAGALADQRVELRQQDHAAMGPADQRREHWAQNTSDGTATIVPQWSPPTSGGSTRCLPGGRCLPSRRRNGARRPAAGALAPVRDHGRDAPRAAMEPADQRREHPPPRRSSCRGCTAAMEPADQRREHMRRGHWSRTDHGCRNGAGRPAAGAPAGLDRPDARQDRAAMEPADQRREHVRRVMCHVARV